MTVLTVRCTALWWCMLTLIWGHRGCLLLLSKMKYYVKGNIHVHTRIVTCSVLLTLLWFTVGSILYWLHEASFISKLCLTSILRYSVLVCMHIYSVVYIHTYTCICLYVHACLCIIKIHLLCLM